MSISVTPGAQIRSGHSVDAVEVLAQSTATALQTVSTTYRVTSLGLGTASGDIRNNVYSLATGDGWEGMEKIVQAATVATATGYASLHLSDATATGAYVFLTGTDMVVVRQVQGSWYLVHNSGATLATATD